jgi:hypothetical protein
VQGKGRHRQTPLNNLLEPRDSGNGRCGRWPGSYTTSAR